MHKAMVEHEVYAAIGSEGFERLCAAFYRQVPEDDILGPMYPADDMLGAEQRLRLSDLPFWRTATVYPGAGTSQVADAARSVCD